MMKPIWSIWKTSKGPKGPLFFFKKIFDLGQKPIDRFFVIVYNKDTVEDTEGIGERLDMLGRGGGFFIYKSITKNFFEKIAFFY